MSYLDSNSPPTHSHLEHRVRKSSPEALWFTLDPILCIANRNGSGDGFGLASLLVTTTSNCSRARPMAESFFLTSGRPLLETNPIFSPLALKSAEERPSIAFFYLKCENESSLRVEVCKKDEPGDILDKLKQTKNGDSFELDGKTYQLMGGPRGALDFIYEDLPLLSFVYKELQYAF